MEYLVNDQRVGIIDPLTFTSIENIPLFNSNRIQSNFLITIDPTTNYTENSGWDIYKSQQSGIPNFITTDSGTKNNGNSTISFPIAIPIDGTYDIVVKSKVDARRGTLRYNIDDGGWSGGIIPYLDIPWPENKIDFIELGDYYLEQGTHNIKIMNGQGHYEGYQDIYNILFYKKDQSTSDKACPELSFQRIASTKYLIKIKTMEPYVLIFSDSFHNEWKLYDARDLEWFNVFSKAPLNEAQHFMVNGYANAWYINKVGDYELTLYFRPQSMFYFGLIVSIITFIACIIILYLLKKKVGVSSGLNFEGRLFKYLFW